MLSICSADGSGGVHAILNGPVLVRLSVSGLSSCKLLILSSYGWNHVTHGICEKETKNKFN